MAKFDEVKPAVLQHCGEISPVQAPSSAQCMFWAPTLTDVSCNIAFTLADRRKGGNDEALNTVVARAIGGRQALPRRRAPRRASCSSSSLCRSKPELRHRFVSSTSRLSLPERDLVPAYDFRSSGAGVDIGRPETRRFLRSAGSSGRSFGSRSLKLSSRQISLSTAPPSANACSSGSGSNATAAR